MDFFFNFCIFKVMFFKASEISVSEILLLGIFLMAYIEICRYHFFLHKTQYLNDHYQKNFQV